MTRRTSPEAGDSRDAPVKPSGDPSRHATLEDLERRLAALSGAPLASGRVALLVRRGGDGSRETLHRAYLTPEGGIPGDAWGRQAHPPMEAQIAVMQVDVAELIANGQPLTLFGDGLFLALDLSTANLPPGSRIRAGAATLEVTSKAHNGCRKFRARFGADALRFVSRPDLRHRNLRGIYMRVVLPGEVAPGDPAEVISRAPGALPSLPVQPPQPPAPGRTQDHLRNHGLAQ